MSITKKRTRNKDGTFGNEYKEKLSKPFGISLTESNLTKIEDIKKQNKCSWSMAVNIALQEGQEGCSTIKNKILNGIPYGKQSKIYKTIVKVVKNAFR